jgi:hypothetical protein
MTGRRFPSPWTVVEHAESFWVQDATGQTVGWFYFRADPMVARTAGVLLKITHEMPAGHADAEARFL